MFMPIPLPVKANLGSLLGTQWEALCIKKIMSLNTLPGQFTIKGNKRTPWLKSYFEVKTD